MEKPPTVPAPPVPSPTADQLARVRAQAHADRELYVEGTSQWMNADATLALLDSYAALVAREAKLRAAIARLRKGAAANNANREHGWMSYEDGILTAMDAIEAAMKP